MIKKNILAGLIVLVAGSLLLGACSAQQTPTAAPTVDANAIYTQAAQTVQAGMAQTEAAQPATPTTPPPTDTPAVAPTNTVDPTLASAMTATANSVLPGAATATLGTTTPSALGTATATLTILRTNTVAAPKATGDKAELVGQVPGDGSRIPSGASFDVALTFKNTGVTTWTPKYTLRFFAGDKMGSPNDFNFTKNVKPGETITLNFTMGGSTTKGKKTTIWVLQNADGANFYSLYLQSEVVP